MPNGEVRPRAFAPATPQVEYKTTVPSAFVPQKDYKRETFQIPDGSGDGGGANRRWKKYLPGFLALGGVIWGGYAYKFVMDDTPVEYLAKDKFTPFVITNKLIVDDEHYMIELTPKYSKWRQHTKIEQIWNGNRLWSVEIKQPQIMVVRRYTPLPLELYDSEFTKQPVIRVQDQQSVEGKLVLYIKKYSQGEVARWIDRQKLGSELELRGPYEEFRFPVTKNNSIERPRVRNVPSDTPKDPEFPIKPMDMSFYAAGTGITPVLQLLLTRNPYRGFIDVYHSSSAEPIPQVCKILERADRAEFHQGIGGPSGEFALVCGPDGYVTTLAGVKPFEGQGELGGYLKRAGWSSEQVFKMD